MPNRSSAAVDPPGQAPRPARRARPWRPASPAPRGSRPRSPRPRAGASSASTSVSPAVASSTVSGQLAARLARQWSVTGAGRSAWASSARRGLGPGASGCQAAATSRRRDRPAGRAAAGRCRPDAPGPAASQIAGSIPGSKPGRTTAPCGSVATAAISSRGRSDRARRARRRSRGGAADRPASARPASRPPSRCRCRGSGAPPSSSAAIARPVAAHDVDEAQRPLPVRRRRRQRRAPVAGLPSSPSRQSAASPSSQNRSISSASSSARSGAARAGATGLAGRALGREEALDQPGQPQMPAQRRDRRRQIGGQRVGKKLGHQLQPGQQRRAPAPARPARPRSPASARRVLTSTGACGRPSPVP